MFSYFRVIRWLTSLVADNAGTDKRGHVVEWVEKASFDRLNKLFEITTAERHHQTLLTARNMLTVVREPQSYITNILPRKLPKKVVSVEHFVLKDLPFYKRARKADAKARQKLLDEQEEKRQEETLRKTCGEKGCDSPPAARPPARKEKKKTKKTLSQVFRISAPNLEASSSSCRSGSNRPDHTIPESEEEPEAISSSLQLVVFHPGPNSPQLEPESISLQVTDKPDEMRSPSELRERLMQRHGKRLHVPIDLGPPPDKKVFLDRGGEDPKPNVPAPAATCSDGDGVGASASIPPDAVGSSTAAMVQADAPGRSSPAVVGTPMAEGVPGAPNDEEAPVERNSHAAVVPPSWEELMEMLKGVPCFTNVEARHPLGVSESAVPPIQHLREWTMPEAAKVVNTLLFSSYFFSSYHFSL